MGARISRRACLGVAAAAASPAVSATRAGLALANRSHFLARPEFKLGLVRCFSEILGCGPPSLLPVASLDEPILAFRFPGGGAISFEISAKALPPHQARRGAWLELRCDAAAEVRQAVLAAGYPQVRYVTGAFYFEAPGGQVFGVAGPAA